MTIAPLGLLLLLAGAVPVLAQAPAGAPPAPAIPVAELDESHQAAIDYDRSNRMTVPVRINQTEAVPFLVDTGSERTVVSEELAVRLGLPRAGDVQISSVAGTSMAGTARVQALGFTNISVNDLIAPILQGHHMGAEGLIGIDSLQHKTVIFDFDRHRMEIRKSKSRAVASRVSNPEEIVVVARSRSGRMIVTDARIDGVDVTVVIDSGAQYSIGNPALMARLEQKRKLRERTPTMLYSVTGQAIEAQVAKVRRLYVGKMELREMPVAFADSPAFATLRLDKKPALLLGMNTLRAFRRVEVDFANRRVRFIIPDSAGFAVDQRYADGCLSSRRSVQCGQLLPAS